MHHISKLWNLYMVQALTFSDGWCSCRKLSRALSLHIALSFLLRLRVTVIDAVWPLQVVHVDVEGLEDLLKVGAVGCVAFPAALH